MFLDKIDDSSSYANLANHPDMHLMICHMCVLVFTEILGFLKQIIVLIWDFLLFGTNPNLSPYILRGTRNSSYFYMER